MSFRPDQIPADNDRLAIGGNQPPLSEVAAMEIEERLAEFAERKKGILASLERVTVVDNETTGAAADFKTICQTFLNKVDVERREAKEPYDSAVTVIQSKVAAFTEPVQEAIRTVDQKIRDFRDDQRARQRKRLKEQREEEARLRAAAAARQKGELPIDPPAPAPEVKPTEISLPVARGDYGSKVKDKVEKTYRIVDVRALPDTILDSPKVRSAMLAAIKQLARLQSEIPGVEVDEGVTDVIRKGG